MEIGPFSYEYIEDRWHNKLFPPKKVNPDGSTYTLVYIYPYVWGGLTKGGFFVDHESEKLPYTYGVVVAMHPSCSHFVINLPRSMGGICPGDLVHYPRYSTTPISFIKVKELYLDEKSDKTKIIWTTYPLLAVHDAEILARIDNVLADPWKNLVDKVNHEGVDLKGGHTLLVE